MSRQAPSFSHSLPCELREYPEWHRGRRLYAVWLLEVDAPPVLTRWQRARAHLADWLHPGYRRQPHITLGVAGFWGRQPKLADDLCPERLALLRQALRESPPATFELRIGAADSFASAPFLRVCSPPGCLEALRARLCPEDDQWRDTPYQPHLTLGLYRQRVTAAELRQRLTAFAEHEPLPLRCRHLSLCVYRARDPQGRLRALERFALADG